jgi:hypothetical protein
MKTPLSAICSYFLRTSTVLTLLLCFDARFRISKIKGFAGSSGIDSDKTFAFGATGLVVALVFVTVIIIQ